MASIFASVFGWAQAEESKGVITLSGVDSRALMEAMTAYFSSPRVYNAIFLKSNDKTLQFFSFFALEVWIICKQIQASPDQYKHKRIAARAQEALEASTWIGTMLSPKIKPCVDMRLLAQTMSWKPDRHQLEAVQRYGDTLPRLGLTGYLLAAPPGTGKSSRKDAKIKIPGGWTTMGELRPGDYITSWNGNTTTVREVFDQGVLPAYKVSFSDGRSTVVSAPHLWKVRWDITDSWSVRTTSELMEMLEHATGTFSIPLYHPALDDECEGNILRLQELHPNTSEDYHTTDKALAEEVEYLVRSQGGLARVVEDDGYTVQILLPDDDLRLELVAIEQVEDAHMVCIYVDDPEHLYVTDDFIVTHNTFIDLCIMAAVIPRQVAEVKIIISPINAIRLVWEDTVEQCFKKRPTSWVSDTAGDPPPAGIEYYIFHYEAMEKADKLTKLLDRRRVKYVVIIDESHNFNTIGTKRTDLLVNICRRGQGPLSVWASGSPVKAVAKEAVPLLRSIDKRFTPEAEARFMMMYSANKAITNDILNRRLGLMSYKISSKVVTGMPETTSLRRLITLPDPEPFILENIRAALRADMEKRAKIYSAKLPHYEERFYRILDIYQSQIRDSAQVKALIQYRTMLDRAKASRHGGRPDSEALAYCRDFERNALLPALPPMLAKEFRQIRSIVKTFMLKVRGEALGAIYVTRRAECGYQLAIHGGIPELIDKGLGKTLIFSTYSSTLSRAQAHFTKLGYQCLGVYGPTAKQVTPLVYKFMHEKEYNPLFASFAALSTAVPVYVANQVIMLDVPPRQYVFDQTVARAARKKQENPVFSYEFILDTPGRPNISTRGIDILDWSREQVSVIMGPEFGGPDPDDIVTQRYLGASDIRLESKPSDSWGVLRWLGF